MLSRCFVWSLGQTQISTNVEQVILNIRQQSALGKVLHVRGEQAEDCIQLIDRAVRGNTWVIFGNPRAVAQGRFAFVTRFGVNAREVNHDGTGSRLFAFAKDGFVNCCRHLTAVKRRAHLSAGRTVVVVAAGDRAYEAFQILRSHGGRMAKEPQAMPAGRES